jgi:hypothetical protein
VATTPEPTSAEAVSAALERALGTRATLQVDRERTDGSWSLLCGQPRTPEGGSIDYARTTLREEAAEGILEDRACVLVETTDAGPVVRELSVGGTDMEFLDWQEQYGLPRNLFE